MIRGARGSWRSSLRLAAAAWRSSWIVRGGRAQRIARGAAIHKGGSLAEGRAARRAARGFRRRYFAPVEPLDQPGEQAPEERVTGIAADAPDLAAFLDQHEHRREALTPDEREFGRHGPGDVERGAAARVCLRWSCRIRRDLAIELQAPHAALLLEHDELGGTARSLARAGREEGAREGASS